MGFQRKVFASSGEFGEVFLERVASEFECEYWWICVDVEMMLENAKGQSKLPMWEVDYVGEEDL